MKQTTLTALSGVVLLILVCFSIGKHAIAKEKDIEIKGYITQVLSPTSFELDDYRVSVEGKDTVELENIDKNAIKSDPMDLLKVGTFVKIKGRVDAETLTVTVKQLKIDSKQFRTFSKTTVLDSAPTDVKKLPDGSWSGTIVADARRIRIGPGTVVRFKLNKSEEKAAKEAAKTKAKNDNEEQQTDTPVGDSNRETKATDSNMSEAADTDRAKKNETEDESFDEEDDIRELLVGSRPLESLDQVVPGVYMTYRGKENLDGTVIASEVVFVRNEKTKQEKQMWKELRLKEKEGKNENSFIKLKVGKTEYKAVPVQEVQEYVNRLGNKLIPQYQRQLPDEDENKIPFKFVVIYQKGFNATAYPTGTVVIDHEDFDYLENEAQFAFVLSHEIAHATQEHAIRAENKDKGKRTALVIGGLFAGAMGYGGLANILRLTEAAMINGYARNLENQADRIGLSYMLAAGYDPREAPRTWKAISLQIGDSPTNFFWDNHASNAERRSFLMLTLRNTYADVDFTQLKKDSDKFHQIAGIIQEKYPRKKKKEKVAM